MKAAQFFAQRDLRVISTPSPTPKSHEALIAIEWCGICGSDTSEYLHGPLTIPRESRPHPSTGEHLPVTMGHEFCGRIISAPASSHLVSGQPVIVDPRIYCSTCAHCNAGSTHACSTLGFKGLSGSGGGFAERVAVDAKLCYALPETVDLRLAALIEPLAVAWHAVKLCGVAEWAGNSVLILGGGPVGIACVFVLRALGCKHVYVSEPAAARAVHNRTIADAVLDPMNEHVGDRCRELTGGGGVDVVFDCAGMQKGMDAGMDALKFRGTYMNVASWIGMPMVIPFIAFIKKEIAIKCSLAYDDEDFKETVDAFVAGEFKGVETMVTSRIHLDDISEKGFDELVTNKDDHVKILVTP
ncbi:threonine dehydrogenase, partial [Dothidotthia symphoricarpi CBS 119687]